MKPADIRIELGTGKGYFTTHATYPLPGLAQAISIVTGDFNHDGKPDLAVYAAPEDPCGIGTPQLIIYSK